MTDTAANKVSAITTASDEDVIPNAYRSPATGGNLLLPRRSFVGSTSQNGGNAGTGIPFTSAPVKN